MTFRHPGNFAKVVTTVDEMSGGRIEVGLGAGWNDLEHRQLGLPFPPIKERADLLEDQLAILHGLWGEPDGWSYDGHVVSIEDAELQPEAGRRARPAADADRWRAAADHRRRQRVAARRYRLAARCADEFNISSRRPGHGRRVFAELDAACEAIGRDPATLTRSAMTGVLIGRTRRRSATRSAAMTRTPSVMTPVATGWPSASSAGSSGRPTRARDGPAVRGRGRRADHAPGLPALGPRHDRRHGRGTGRPGLAGPAGSAPGGVAAALRVDGIVAADLVGVRAARTGDALGQELERGRGPEQRGDRRRQAGASATSNRPAGVSFAGQRHRRASAARMAVARIPTHAPRRRAPAAPARGARARPVRSARISTSPVSEPVAGRWPWRNVSRSR